MTLSTKLLFTLAAVGLPLGFFLSAESAPTPATGEAIAAQPYAEAEAETTVPPGPATVFESEHAEMQTFEEETRFLLTGNVRVTGNNIRVFCDRLEVYATRGGDRQTEGLVEPGGIYRILATGKVRIEQEGREATAGRAEVFPGEGRIVFTETPVLRDAQGMVTGHRITFYQGESRAVVEGGGEEGPARITLPTLPDLGPEGQLRPRRESERAD